MPEALQETDPRRIGPYEVEGLLGAGGMGRVYLGRDEDGGRVAVKVVHPDLARDAEFRKRLRREAAATRDLDVPGVARVLAADPDADIPWLAMEFVDGPSLHDVVTEHGPLAPAAVLELGRGLARSLAAIHDAGLVHRDVKPPNVLLAAGGPCLIDFGIARDVAESTITRTGFLIGTPQFMAPEQLQAERTVAAPADVFALGGVLAFAATGRAPFGGGSPVQLLLAVTTRDPQLDGVPGSLRPLLLSCLAKDPARRPTAAELVTAFADGELPTHAVAVPAAAVESGVEPRVESGVGLAAEPIAAAEPTAEPEPGRPDSGAPAATEVGQGRRSRRIALVAAGVAVVVAAAAALLHDPGAGHAADGAGLNSTTGSATGTATTTQNAGQQSETPSGPSSAPPSIPAASSKGGVPGATIGGGTATPSSVATGTGPAGSGIPVPSGATIPARQPSSPGASGSHSSNPAPPTATTTAVCTNTTIPCRKNSVPTVQTVHLTGTNGCLVQGYVRYAPTVPAMTVTSVCSGPTAQWLVWRGTTGSTFQLESASKPGLCIVYKPSHPDLVACDQTAANQWFVTDFSADSQVSSNQWVSSCLFTMAFNDGTFEAPGWAGCGAGTPNWRFS